MVQRWWFSARGISPGSPARTPSRQRGPQRRCRSERPPSCGSRRREPPSSAVTFHVIVIVPASAGSSATKSTACTTRSPGTISVKRPSTMSDSQWTCRRRGRGVRVGQHHSVGPTWAGDRSARTGQSSRLGAAIEERIRIDECGIDEVAWRRSNGQPCQCESSEDRTDCDRVRGGRRRYRLRWRSKPLDTRGS